MDIIILAVLVIGMFVGYKRGLINGIFSLLGGVIALILALATYKPIAAKLVPLTGWDKDIQAYVESAFSNMKGENTSDISSLLENISGADVVINQASSDVTVKISNFVVNMLTLGALFIIYKIIVIIVKNMLNNLAELPLLNITNRIGGLIFGTVETILIIMIVFAGIYFANVGGYALGLDQMINNSIVAKEIYNKNIFVKLLVKDNLSEIIDDAKTGVNNGVNRIENKVGEELDKRI